MIKRVYLMIIVLEFLSTGNLVAQNIHGSFDSKFKRYQKNERFDGTESLVWNATAWKGERLSKQIILWSDSTLSGLTYSVSDLTTNGGVIAASNISLKFPTYVKGDPEARSCGGYPTHPSVVELADALSENEVEVLHSSDPIQVWLSIDVPNTAITGEYSGTISVNGGSAPLVFDVNLKVVDYTLPDTTDWSFHLDLWQFPVNILNHYNTANPSKKIAIWSDEHFALFEPTYRLLAKAGQKVITTSIKENALGSESMVKWTKKTNGTWEYDFTVFDKYVNALTSWGISKQISCFSPVGWNETVIPYWDEATGTKAHLSAPLGSTAYNARWDHFLTAFSQHLVAKAWFDKVVLYLDEVEASKLNSVVSVVHGNNPNWKLGIAYSEGLSNVLKADFYDLSGILEDASNTGISKDKISTFYTSCTQQNPNNYVTPENSPAEMTWMGWHAFKEGYDGYLRWAFDYWRLSDPFDARDGGHTAGDFSMVYRDSNNSPSNILSSIRFEMLRDGIQDYEKLKILRAALESSLDPQQQDVLIELNNVIDTFGKSSGVGAEQLVIQAQKAIEEIILGTFSYCRVNGGTNTSYYVQSLSTTGGDKNITFSTNQYPNTGYERHVATNGFYVNEKIKNGNESDRQASVYNSKWSNFQSTNILTYEREFNEKHKLKLTGIYEQQIQKYNENWAGASGFLTNAVTYNNLGLGDKPLKPSSDRYESSLESYMGWLNYAYDGKYSMTLTGRSDAASVFSKNNKHAFFASLGLAWTISNENFLKKSDVIDNLKLRGSYGEVGNAAIRPYQSLDKLKTGTDFSFSGTSLFTGVSLDDQAANPNLKWETTESYNIGLDLSMFENRLNLTADYYNKTTSDLLLERATLQASGQQTQLVNAGEVENKGIEIALSVNPIKKEHFSWVSDITFSKNENKVLALYDGNTELRLNYDTLPGHSSAVWLEVGQPIGLIRGMQFDGLWGTDESILAAVYGVTPGSEKYIDQNNDGSYGIGEDAVNIGNALPDFTYSLNNTFTYKDFSLNIFAVGVQGNDIYNVGRSLIEGEDGLSVANLNVWTPDNQNTTIAAHDAKGGFRNSSKWIEDGSCFRIKNITLGYNFNEGLKNSLGMSSLRVYLSGTNLFTVTNYSGFDPESNTSEGSDTFAGIDLASYPSQKQYTIGVDIKF